MIWPPNFLDTDKGPCVRWSGRQLSERRSGSGKRLPCNSGQCEQNAKVGKQADACQGTTNRSHIWAAASSAILCQFSDKEIKLKDTDY